MNRLQTTLVFGAIFAAVLGTTLTVDGLPVTQFVTASQPTSSGITMLGHVEMIVHDSEGNIVQYSQGDNMIVETGGDCIARALFDSATTVGLCDTAIADWEYIAIGNGTGSAVAVGDTQLDESSADDGLSTTGTVHNGEMARKLVTPSFDVTGTNAIVTLTNSADPFDFVTNNATTVEQSALYNAAGTANANGETTALGGDILALQDLSPAVTVGDGDSLTVTWTVTVGTG